MREREAGVPGGNSRLEGATRVDIGVERTHSCVHMYRFYLFLYHRSLVLLSVPGVPGAVVRSLVVDIGDEKRFKTLDLTLVRAAPRRTPS